MRRFSRLSLLVLCAGAAGCAGLLTGIGPAAAGSGHERGTRSQPQLALRAPTVVRDFPHRTFQGLPGPRHCSIATGQCVTGCTIPVASAVAPRPGSVEPCAGARSSRPCMLPIADSTPPVSSGQATTGLTIARPPMAATGSSAPAPFCPSGGSGAPSAPSRPPRR